ncbi:MAG TPA: hydrogenase maturation nickel metallochaperone HypA [Candidatus Dormibacteraeota bacterium]
MHELGLAEGILTIATDMAGDHAVTRIVVRIGEEQRIVPDSLEFGFQLLAEGTVCEGAVLHCVAVTGVTVLVDEVELDGNPPTVLRRPGSEVIEPPHQHPQGTEHGATPAPFLTANRHGGT